MCYKHSGSTVYQILFAESVSARAAAARGCDALGGVFRHGIGSAGIAWTAGVLVLLPQSEGYQIAMLLVTLLCVSSVAAASLSMHYVSYCTFMLIMLVPTATWCRSQPSDIRFVAAGMWAGLAILLFTGYAAWLSNSQLLRTEYELAQALLTAADARTVAEDANRAKSRFLANMSHEVRTPLNGVLGMAEILSASPLDGEQRRQVGMLQQSAQHLLGVVNDILDLAKVEAGWIVMEQRPIDLRGRRSTRLWTCCAMPRSARV